MLLVQKYLRSGNSLDDLAKEHGVYATITNGKISLNYDQLEVSNSDLLACECRGLILEEGSYDIIAFPFRRFFNLEQVEFAAKIYWESARYQEKMDGSMICVYFYKDHWYAATRSRPEADVPLQSGDDLTFSKLADHACDKMYSAQLALNQKIPEKTMSIQDLMEDLFKSHPDTKNKTFMFELTSPYNRVVCRYDDVKLTLIGVRDNKTLAEEDPENWIGQDRFGLKIPEVYSFNNIEHMVKVIREWNPEEHEGVVVLDKYWNRVKVKNPAWLAASHMRTSLETSVKNCISVILLGKDDDIIGMMPELIANRIIRLKPVVQKVISTTQQDWEELRGIDDMKTYALAAKERLWPAALFALKRGKTTDLKTFSLGNQTDITKIPSSSSEMMLELCKKIDPDVGKLV
jgi:hypothetical protein